MPEAQRDAGWGPVQAHAEAARAAAAALREAGLPVELHEPNLPVFAEADEAKLLARAHKEGGPRLWRGDPFLLLADRSRLLDLVRHLRDGLGYSLLVDVTAVDYDAAEPHIWGVYQLLSLARKSRLTVKVHIPKDDCRIQSVVGVYPGADWHEREAAEMFGITYEGHPDPRHMLLPDDWAGFPLRKDYKFPEEYHGISCV